MGGYFQFFLQTSMCNLQISCNNFNIIIVLSLIHGAKCKSPPFVNALKVVAEQEFATFLFPGHNKGQGAPVSMTELIGESPFLHDASALDNLSTPQGPLLEAQKQAAEVFGASKTWFLVGGTTCGIHAAIMGACSPGDSLILSRSSHKSAISAMVLCGVTPEYIFPDFDVDFDIPTTICPYKVKKAIEELRSEGLCSNIKEISTLCHLHNIPLIMDEAHGAHLGFHPSLPSPALQQGADVVVQSTHKFLFSLTQSSMLHVSRNNNIIDIEKIDTCLQTLQSTSPSSLLLASLDATTAELSENPSNIFDDAINLALEAKNALKQIPGIAILELPCTHHDPLRVTVGVADLGISGYEADEFLFKDQKVISELPGSRFITYLFPPRMSKEHLNRLIQGFKNLSSFHLLIQHDPEIIRTKKMMNHVYDSKFKALNLDVQMQLTPREAFFAKKKKVDIKDVGGMVCGELICPFPPGIPVLCPGEVISEEVIDTLLQSKNDGAEIVGARDPLLSSMIVCNF